MLQDQRIPSLHQRYLVVIFHPLQGTLQFQLTSPMLLQDQSIVEVIQLKWLKIFVLLVLIIVLIIHAHLLQIEHLLFVRSPLPILLTFHFLPSSNNCHKT